MIEDLEKRFSSMKQQLVAELTATVVSEIRQIAEELRRSGPDALSRKDACRRLGFGMTKLKGMIARGQIFTCIGDPTRIPMSEIRRFTEPAPRPMARPHGGGRKKRQDYDPRSAAAALRNTRR